MQGLKYGMSSIVRVLSTYLLHQPKPERSEKAYKDLPFQFHVS